MRAALRAAGHASLAARVRRPRLRYSAQSRVARGARPCRYPCGGIVRLARKKAAASLEAALDGGAHAALQQQLAHVFGVVDAGGAHLLGELAHALLLLQVAQRELG